MALFLTGGYHDPDRIRNVNVGQRRRQFHRECKENKIWQDFVGRCFVKRENAKMLFLR